MKKLLIIMTLFMSSFFFFLPKDVMASSLTFDDYSLVNSDVFLTIKNKADELKENNSFNNYLIVYNFSELTYYVHFFNESEAILHGVTNAYGFTFSTMDNYNFDLSTSNLVLKDSFPYSVSSYPKKYAPIYCTTDVLFEYSLGLGSFLYTTPNFSKTYSSSYDNGLFPLLYDVCVDFGNCSPIDDNNPSIEFNPHEEELVKVQSFYTIVIEKLGYLAETIVSNYIYLSIIVIFILIFVFLLIFRRFIC